MHAIIKAVYGVRKAAHDGLGWYAAEVALDAAILAYESKLVPCPHCDGEHYGPTTDAECPHPTCELCNGAGEVEEHVAAYVQKIWREGDGEWIGTTKEGA